jgi:hypothetical protein
MRHVTSLFIVLVLTGGVVLNTVVIAQVTCQTNGNTTNCNGSLGGSTIHDNGAFTPTSPTYPRRNPVRMR